MKKFLVSLLLALSISTGAYSQTYLPWYNEPNLSTPSSSDLILIYHPPASYTTALSNLWSIPVSDIITKSPWVDVRSFMDGQSGRPTYATWLANQATTDVTAVIQAALDTGGNVFFPTGTFLISMAHQSGSAVGTSYPLYASGFLIPYGRIISGSGIGKTIIQVYDDGTNLLTAIAMENTILQDVEINGGFVPGSHGGMGTGIAGIDSLVMCSARTIVQRCYLHNTRGSPIASIGDQLVTEDYHIYRDNILENFGDHAIYISSTDIAQVESNFPYNVTIENNRITYNVSYQNNVSNGTNRPSIQIRRGVTGILISGNYVYGGTPVSFTYGQWAQNAVPAQVRVVNNDLFADYGCIDVESETAGTDNGYRFTDLLIEGNFLGRTSTAISGNLPLGIYFYHAGANIIGNRFVGLKNDAGTNGNCISVNAAPSDTATERVIVENNEFINGYNGIYMLSKQSIIKGNTFVSMAGYAIEDGYKSHIIGNTFNSCALGIDIEVGNTNSALWTVVQGNVFQSNTLAVFIAGSVNNLTITNNDFMNNTTTATTQQLPADYNVCQIYNNRVSGTAWPTTNNVSAAIMSISYSNTQKITYGTAAPTTMTWAVGDICWNTAPASGQPTGWICTTGGTSGTWKPMANLP
jgi:hypothetical protein